MSTTDERIFKLIKKKYRETFTYGEGARTRVIHRATNLKELYTLRGLEPQEIWTALSRLVLAKKIEACGSNRHKCYRPLPPTPENPHG